MPLVEVVLGDRTDEAAAASMMTLLYEVGKRPLLVKRYLPGFVVNRFQLALNGMAYMILQEGVLDPEDIDHAVESSIGLRLATGGPFATMDLGGLDVVAASARTMGFEPPGPPAGEGGARRAGGQDRQGVLRVCRAWTRKRSCAAATGA